ncbi:MAG: hypothetical protein DUD32_04630 [Lactobacillus sp.]|jgi:hypothetical protein|nr:MAG: hypothetical protein DUD32_04630 [Lactobacillus sp.]
MLAFIMILVIIYAVCLTFGIKRITLGKNVIETVTAMIASAVLLVPLFLRFGIQGMPSKVGNNSDWLNFWGGYLGSIVGVMGAALFAWINTKMQINRQAKIDFDNQILLIGLSTINELIRTIGEMYTHVSILLYDCDDKDSHGKSVDVKKLLQDIDKVNKNGIDKYNRTVLALLSGDEEWKSELDNLNENVNKLRIFKPSGNQGKDINKVHELSDNLTDSMKSLMIAIKFSYNRKIGK